MKDLTLNNLFFSKAKGKGGGADEVLGREKDSLIGLESDLKEHLPKVPFKSVEKELGAKIGEVLNVGLDEVLLAAWKKYEGFREYADPEKHPPEETILVPLAKHTIESAHSPHVDLMIKDVLIGSVHLEVELALELEGVVLKVQGGKILDVRAGSCQAAGSLACRLESKAGAKEILSLQKQTPKLQLRGTIQLGDGIAIPPPGAPAAS